jgi:hypothetical protein
LSGALAAVGCLLAGAASATAQDTTGELRGTIVDPQGLPVPRATVSAAGPQGASAATTNEAGYFSFPFLTPGIYDVRAEVAGFKAFEQQEVIVALGQTVRLRVQMEVGTVAETVQVAAGPMIDQQTATVDTVLSSDFLNSVPVGRQLADTLYLAPGVSGSGTVGQMNPSISGGSGLDNQYVIDGVNVTSTGYGGLGSFSSVFRSLGNAIPFDFIKDVQITTAGAGADVSHSLGGRVNVVTQSGTNTQRSSLFAYARPEALEAAWTEVQTPNGTVQTAGSRSSDVGATTGGALVQNRLFFFGALNPARDVQTYRAPDGFPLLSLGDVDRVRTSLSYSAKATYQVNGRHRLDASFFGDPSEGREGAQRAAALLAQTQAQFSALAWGGHSQTLRYEGVPSDRWLLSASYGRSLNTFSETPTENIWQYRDQTVVPNVRSGGVGAYEPGNRGVNDQFAVRSTNLLGAHTLEYGMEHHDAEWTQLRSYTGPTFTAPNGMQTQSGAVVRIVADPVFGRIYRVSNAFFEGNATTSQRYQGWFVQDTWRLGRLSLMPGLRLDRETIDGSLTKDWSLGTNVAPRVSAAFDAAGDGRTRVSGSWGRFHARVPNDLAARLLSDELIVTRADYFDAELTRPIPNGTQAGGTTAHFATIGGAAHAAADPEAKLPYVDELAFGVEHELLRNTSVSIRYMHRSIGRILEDLANCPVAGFYLPQTGEICGHVEFVLANPRSDRPINPEAVVALPDFADVSFADPAHRYHAVELALNRRFSGRWSGLAWYRWSRLRGNYEGFYREDNGQSDPGVSTLYDMPQNDPTFTAIGGTLLGFQGDIRHLGDPDGILPLDRPHQFRLVGHYTRDSLNLGLSLHGRSGTPLTPMAPHPIPGYQGGEIPLAPRGSGIETVDGFRTRTPFATQVDVQVGYQLRFDALRRLTLVADIFNLFDQQPVQGYDTWRSLSFGGPDNPNFGQPTSSVLNIPGARLQAPRQIRLGARLSF